MARMRIEVITELMHDDLPAPVAPAIKRCGISARFTITGRPAMSLPEGDLEGMGGSLGLDRLQHAAEGDELAVTVGHLDADRRPARDRGKDAHVGRGHGVGDVLGEGGHPGHFHAGTELELETGHRRSDRVADEVGLDAVAGEGTLEHAAALLDRFAVELLFLAPLQELQGRKLPRPRTSGRPAS